MSMGSNVRPGEPTLPFPPEITDPVTPISWRSLYAGVPAVLVAVLFVALMIVAVPDNRLALDYKRAAQRALAARKFDTALVCYKRLVALNPGKDEDRYALVLLLDQLGKPEKAEAIARAIAPIDRTGYGPAHYWQARRIVTDPERLRRSAPLVEGHLLRFLKGTPDSIEAKGMLGTLYMASGRLREARPYLEAATTRQPDRLMELSRVCNALGDYEAAETHKQNALKFAQETAEQRTDDPLAWLQWASVVSQLGEYQQAISILDRGEALTHQAAFPRAKAAVCNLWVGALEKDGKSTPAERLDLINRGLHYDPENTALIEQMSRIMASGGEPAEKARAALREQLAAGRTPALAHFLLGSDAWALGKAEEARTHWEQAHRLDPGFAVVSNNLAWMLAYREPVDLPRAFRLVEEAVARNPIDPRFRATRGQVLTRMGRWKDALHDLESALAAGQDTPAVHEALAETYEHLGMSETAKLHREKR